MRFDVALHRKLIPEALKRAREQAGLSIDDTARQSGIDHLTLWNHESGRNLPSMESFLFELQTYGLDLGRFHEVLLEAYADLVQEEVSQRMDELEMRLKTIEQASAADVKAR